MIVLLRLGLCIRIGQQTAQALVGMCFLELVENLVAESVRMRIQQIRFVVSSWPHAFRHLQVRLILGEGYRRKLL